MILFLLNIAIIYEIHDHAVGRSIYKYYIFTTHPKDSKNESIQERDFSPII